MKNRKWFIRGNLRCNKNTWVACCLGAKKKVSPLLFLAEVDLQVFGRWTGYKKN